MYTDVNEGLCAVFFDFDGVICDSTDIKTNAFADLYASYGDEVVAKVREHHIQNGGISRYKKLAYFQRHILGKNSSDSEIERLATKFAGLVVERVVASPFVEGALEALEGLRDRCIPMFVVSGTPQEELREIIRRKSLEKYFKGVYGSPSPKSEILKYLLSKHHYPRDQCIFVGDALTDCEASRLVGIPFLGVGGQVARMTDASVKNTPLARFGSV